MSQHNTLRLKSPEIIDPEILKRHDRIVEIALSEFEKLYRPFGWNFSEYLRISAGVPEPVWQNVLDPFEEDKTIWASAVTTRDPRGHRGMAIYEKEPDTKKGLRFRGFFSLEAPASGVGLPLDQNYLTDGFREDSLNSEDAQKLLTLAEKLLTANQ